MDVSVLVISAEEKHKTEKIIFPTLMAKVEEMQMSCREPGKNTISSGYREGS